jgi:hypothetical protein
VKERGILFTGEMVRAILDGRKTVTRRLVKHRGEVAPASCRIKRGTYPNGSEGWFADWRHEAGWQRALHCDYGGPGDVMWVKEAFSACRHGVNHPACVDYRADGREDFKWTSPLYMPRALSRITLEVVDVRVERLWDLTEAEAIAEGVATPSYPPSVLEPHATLFQIVWDRINGKKAPWALNPWVWRVEFRRLVS